ncbi:hypothetical protein DAMA08_001520 [Martiniozyma asiatica (nom. inval.)]|nr:hypothetical protein DAMA08_001520 [Martiniozyma asiatica]
MKQATTTPYQFKRILDEFIYMNSLPKSVIPLVYRSKNASRLLAANLTDKQGRPLVPREHPGYPSHAKTVKFINIMLEKEEVEHFKSTLAGLANLKEGWLKPSVVNAFLVKSKQLDVYAQNLNWLHQLKGYQMRPRNMELISLIALSEVQSGKRSMEKWQDQFSKMHQSLSLDTSKTTTLAALLQLSAKLVAELPLQDSEVESVNGGFLTKVERKEFELYDHAYSVAQAFLQAAQSQSASLDGKLQPAVDKWSAFVKEVDSFKGNHLSIWERITAA